MSRGPKRKAAKHAVLGKRAPPSALASKAVANARSRQDRVRLLAQYKNRHKTNLVSDARFDAETDHLATHEDRVLRAMQRERMRDARRAAFALDDAERVELTHRGRALGEMEDAELARDADARAADDDDTMRNHYDRDGGFGSADFVRSANFGGGGASEYARQRDALNETIARHKLAKLERKEKKEEERNLLGQLDADFADLKGLIWQTSSEAEAKTKAAAKRLAPARALDESRADWGSLTKRLSAELRSQPTTRLRSEAEVASAEKKRLQLLESERLARMQPDSAAGAAARGPTDDDLYENFEDFSMGGAVATDSDADSTEEDMREGARSAASADDDATSSASDASDDADAVDDDIVGSDDGHSADGASDVKDDASEAEEPSGSAAAAADAHDLSDLPYVFPLPKDAHELAQLVKLARGSAVRLREVLHRLIAGHHAKLRDGNRELLAALAQLLLHRLLRAARRAPFELGPLTSAIFSVSAQATWEVARLVRERLCSARASWLREQAMAASASRALTPLAPETLVLLTLCCQLYPVTDFRHPVLTPCALFLGEALRQEGLPVGRHDLRCQLFAAACAMRLSVPASRHMPELVGCAHRLLRGMLDATSPTAPSWSLLGDHAAAATPSGVASSSSTSPPPLLVSSLVGPCALDGAPATRAEAAAIYALVKSVADAYAESPSACELLSPLASELNGVELAQLPKWLHQAHSSVLARVEGALEAAAAERAPLRLQRAAPTPLKQLNPVFDVDFQPGVASARDPDRQRAEAQRLRRQLKKEHKGAVRELRKDAAVLSAARNAEERERSDYLEGRGKRALSLLQDQEFSWKSQKREKKRGPAKVL